ncbi:hypothetical protein AB0E69_39605 [Kribbella sp. NPDC026611]|uniref:hypothetical protein n=1 Tax=Kribbella sp. NPDC026611 TaxID=3154911 RepID=UPI0033EA615E
MPPSSPFDQYPTTTVPWIGVMLAMTVAGLAGPLVGLNWKLILIAVVVAAVAAFAISLAFSLISPVTRSSAWVAAAVVAVGCIGVQVGLGSETASWGRFLVTAFGPYVLFRCVTASMDRLVRHFLVPVLAGLVGAAVYAAAVPLLAAGYPGLSFWWCVGLGAGLGFVEGMVTGALLWRMVPEIFR